MTTTVQDDQGVPGTPPNESRAFSSPQSPYVLINPQNASSASGADSQISPDQPYMLPPAMGDSRDGSTLQQRLSVLSQSSQRARPRPRFWPILVVLVILDLVFEGYIGIRLIAENSHIPIDPKRKGSTDDETSQKIVSLTVAILGVGLMRCLAIAVVAVGNKTDQLGLTIAGICALSTLLLVSIFNLLFQSGMLYLKVVTIPRPSLSLLTSIGLAFTIVEYIAYVLVVGIRIPPTGVSAARMREARRWKRGVRATGPLPHEEEHEEMFREGPFDETRGLLASTERSRSRPQSTMSRSRGNSKYGAIQDEEERGRNIPLPPSPTRSSTLVPELSTSPNSIRSAPRAFPSADADLEAARGSGEHKVVVENADKDEETAVATAPNEEMPDHSDRPISQEVTETEDEEDEDNDDEDEDPNEIMDIPQTSTSTTRDQSRARLALAMTHDPEERKRRSRTLSQLSAKDYPHRDRSNHDDDDEGDDADGILPAQETPTVQAQKPLPKRPRFSLPFSSSSSSSPSSMQSGPLSPLGIRAHGSSTKGKDKMSAKIKSVFKR